MSYRNPTPRRDSSTHRTDRRAQTTIALLLVAFVCLGLTACSSSNSPATAAAARSNKLYQQERAEALYLVHCARGHGIALPAPNAQNNVSTVGVNLKSRRRKAALTLCYQEALKKAAQEHAEERAREGKPAETAPPQRSAQGATNFQQEREHLEEVVSCTRRHGVHLPEPNAHNNINTRGLKSHRDKLVMGTCVQEVANRASREREALAQEQQAGPRRLGEEPTG